MWLFYVLFLTPLVLFVSAFLYETWLSFARLKNPKKGRAGYVTATWEVTHTLLVFTVVMLLMTFTQSLTALASALYWSTFVAAVFLGLRAVAYLYIFYVRRDTKTVNAIDWFFAATHVGAALFLVITVLQALVFIWTKHPVANTEFFPAFVPGLVLVLALCAVPLATLYRTK
jgi:cytochrome bd-type quinol oxidase subunit 2